MIRLASRFRSTSPVLANTPAIRLVLDRILTDPAARHRLVQSSAQYARSTLTDYYFSTGSTPSEPNEIFDRLRWGGQFIYVSPKIRGAEALMHRYQASKEFLLDSPLETLNLPRRHLRLLPGRKFCYFIARKVLLDRADCITNRHSYDVKLVPQHEHMTQYLVVKQVPDYDETVQRLSKRFNGSSSATLQKSARKLVDQVYPIFLTRETAFLKILQRDLPDPYCRRFPEVLGIVKDERGFVRKLTLKWLRLGGKPISQLEFAKQSAELLQVLHDKTQIMHLDLRLDNFVITNEGVGFVDFGSAVRQGEDFNQHSLLRSLQDEIMPHSQVQMDLHRLLKAGTVTSRLFANCYRKIDKAADVFYLVLQMNMPHRNPDFKGLVNFDRHSDQARALAKLSARVLRPEDPDQPKFRTAADIFNGIRELESHLG